MEQDSPHEPNTSSTFLTHWPLVFLEGKVASFGVTFPPTNFPGASSGLYFCRNNEQTAAFAETVLFLFCLQLARSAPSNPHPSHCVAEEWDGAGVALVFCFETPQAEIHQEKHSLPEQRPDSSSAPPLQNEAVKEQHPAVRGSCAHIHLSVQASTAGSKHQLEPAQCSRS